MPTKSSESEFPSGATADQPRSLVLAAILAAAALMMSVTGYSFMAGNHEVYLLEPLRRAGLATFEGDWFVHETLQYHGLFAQVAAWLLRLDAARPGFLMIFLALLLSAAWAWWRIVRALGGDVVAFLVAVVVYHVLLGDRALGFYSLLQDGQFNAANVSAVAFLVGIAMWIERRPAAAGLAFGVAGAFHLNYAVVGVGMWVALLAWGWLSGRTSNVERRKSEVDGLGGPASARYRGGPASPRAVGASGVEDHAAVPGGSSDAPQAQDHPASTFARRFLRRPARTRALPVAAGTRALPVAAGTPALPLLATTLALLPSLANIALALPAKLREREAMPFDRFVDLYVHLRHPHHYDPLAWPWWVWAAFLAPVPLAALAWRRMGVRNAEQGMRNGKDAASGSFRIPSPWSSAARIWLILMGLQFFALLTAGVFWMSETFIQLSLWRFSPHAKLLAVSAVAVWLLSARGRRVAETRSQSAGTAEGVGTGLASADPWHGTTRRLAIAVALVVAAIAIFVASVLVLHQHRHLGLAAAMALVAAGLVAMQSVFGKGGSTMAVLCAIAGLASVIFGSARGAIPPFQSAGEPKFAEAAAWASTESFPSATFLLPPDASAFSLHARRGQVVSFKLVPQLSGELDEWDRRLREVLDVEDLSIYARGVRGYRLSQEAMRRRYDELPAEHLFEVARRHGARYVFRSSADEGVGEEMIAWRGETGAVMYDLTLGTPSPSGEAVTPPGTGEAAAPDAACEEEIR